ncbi:glycosyltransferase family protein [Agaribacter flavus]|uniref:Spore protein YkvP/CgeB glycosyl transferase-like domain-containing protein n=1 Tax=Agaribacter flavus TaxID=1902781 RepID=A0ABV7FTV4_9ALTE
MSGNKYCIASPHKDESWYDYRLYENLKHSLRKLGFVHQAAAKNRIYFLGAPLKKHYPKVGQFDPQANNIALIYCHLQKIHSLREFDHIFVTSEYARRYLTRRRFKGWLRGKFSSTFDTQRKIRVMRPFSSLSPLLEIPEEYRCDISFMGVPRKRPIVEDILPIVEKHGLKFQIIGPSWQNYPGDKRAKAYCIGASVPYKNLPFVAQGATINLVDHHESMKKQGMVSHKYIDLINAGGFVISDNNKDAKNSYNGIVYRSANELEALVLKYLYDHEKRDKKRTEQWNLTKGLTTDAAAKTFAECFVD